MTRRYKNIQRTSFVFSALLVMVGLFEILDGQERILFLKQGRLWETVNLAKMGPSFNNWARSGYGMDFPGYDLEWIAGHIGEAPSHHVGGGFWIGALTNGGEVWGREDFALYAGSVGFESTSKYIATKHQAVFDDDANYFLRADPLAGEVEIETEYAWNPNYIFPYERQAYLPIKVNRKVRQWVSHEEDQDYIIVDYTITNVGDSTMNKTYLMFMYAFTVNERGWSILFPNYNSGARNTRILWDSRRRMMYAYASDFKDSYGNDSYDYWDIGGPKREGEFLAPGYAGLQFLYISPDSSDKADRINKYGWAASHPTQASHPFTNKGTLEEDYAVLKNPGLATDAITSPGDERWGSSRVWTMVSLGPWDIEPGDSIRIVTAELVGSVSYNTAVDPTATSQDIAKGKQVLFDRAEMAQQNFDNGYNVPDPPAAPQNFDVTHLGGQKIGALLTWSAATEEIPDPDYYGDEAFDLVGYHIFRSNYLPIGPWEEIATVLKRDDAYFETVLEQYTFIDTNMVRGESYYYAITAFDNGHTGWPPNPALYPNGVPPLQSSRYLNRTIQPYRAGLGPSQTLSGVLVVPNPFVMSSGLTVPGDEDIIQFVNIPSPCTIRIYTIRGDLVRQIDHNEDVGTATWDQVTNWGQYVESGVYIYHITSRAAESAGETAWGKFSIIR